MARLVFWLCTLAVAAVAIWFPMVLQVVVVAMAVIVLAADVAIRIGAHAIDRWRRF